MQRETKTIETPIGKHKVEMYTYLLGREKRALTNVFLNGDFDFDAEENKVKKMDYGLIDKAEDLAFTTVVVSIDDSKEDILNKILDMRNEDMVFVKNAVNEITSTKLDEEKKTA